MPTEEESMVVLVRVKPAPIALLMVFAIGFFLWGFTYLIRMGNDPGFVLTRSTGVRWAFASLGLIGAAVFSLSFVTQIVNKFVWAIGTSSGISAPMSLRGRAAKLKVIGPPEDISLTVTPYRWGLETLEFANGGERYTLTVSRPNANRVVETFQTWVATNDAGQNDHPNPDLA